MRRGASGPGIPPRELAGGVEREDGTSVVGVPDDLAANGEIEIDEPISRTTRLLTGLAFEATDVVEMAASLEQVSGRPSVSFDRFLAGEGDLGPDLTSSEIPDFVIRDD